MKIIKIEGCASCLHRGQVIMDDVSSAYCKVISKYLNVIWFTNPSYSHPECPLEEIKE